MKLNRAWIAATVTLCALTGLAQSSIDEEAVWKLEHSYWEYVKAQDVASYKTLWHEKFLGWPSYSPQPVRKDHIVDWIARYAAKGLLLKSYSIEPAGSQATGQLVVVHYRVRTVWANNAVSEQPETLRITHTWLRGEKGWQIIGGMSMREPDVEK
jgi:hypothetical protein